MNNLLLWAQLTAGSSYTKYWIWGFASHRAGVLWCLLAAFNLELNWSIAPCCCAQVFIESQSTKSLLPESCIVTIEVFGERHADHSVDWTVDAITNKVVPPSCTVVERHCKQSKQCLTFSYPLIRSLWRPLGLRLCKCTFAPILKHTWVCTSPDPRRLPQIPQAHCWGCGTCKYM